VNTKSGREAFLGVEEIHCSRTSKSPETEGTKTYEEKKMMSNAGANGAGEGRKKNTHTRGQPGKQRNGKAADPVPADRKGVLRR